jgi:hypothetical protein
MVKQSRLIDDIRLPTIGMLMLALVRHPTRGASARHAHGLDDDCDIAELSAEIRSSCMCWS